MKEKLSKEFFKRDVLELAPDLIGKFIVRQSSDGNLSSYQITETEAYRGEEDMACHAHKGRTKRTEIMYHEGGFIYMYLIYGIHWMFNIVSGKQNEPQAVLIRAIENYNGPGKLTKALDLNKSFYGLKIYANPKIWIEDHNNESEIITSPRIGIEYAGEYWKSRLWRYTLKS